MPALEEGQTDSSSSLPTRRLTVDVLSPSDLAARLKFPAFAEAIRYMRSRISITCRSANCGVGAPPQKPLANASFSLRPSERYGQPIRAQGAFEPRICGGCAACQTMMPIKASAAKIAPAMKVAPGLIVVQSQPASTLAASNAPPVIKL